MHLHGALAQTAGLTGGQQPNRHYARPTTLIDHKMAGLPRHSISWVQEERQRARQDAVRVCKELERRQEQRITVLEVHAVQPVHNSAEGHALIEIAIGRARYQTLSTVLSAG